MDYRAVFAVAIVLLLQATGSMAVPAAAQSCTFPVTVTDASGTDVTIQEEPSRVVTLSPSAAQTMWEIDADEKVVGLTKHARYLEGSASRTQVSTEEELVSHETVVDLDPDLVLAPHVVPNETVATLRDAGLTVYSFSQAETIEDVYEKTRLIGRLTGECAGAEETVSSMRAQIGTVREAVEDRDRPDVLYLFFGYTAGDGTFIHEIIETAGGNNVAADANVTGYQQLNPEVLVREDPDWIIMNSENPHGISPEVFNQTTAARKNQTVIVQIEHVNQAAPRIVIAISRLSEHFHPRVNAGANATSPPNSSTTMPPYPGDSADAPNQTASSDSPGQPGFGVIAAIAAVIGILLLSRRR